MQIAVLARSNEDKEARGFRKEFRSRPRLARNSGPHLLALWAGIQVPVRGALAGDFSSTENDSTDSHTSIESASSLLSFHVLCSSVHGKLEEIFHQKVRNFSFDRSPNKRPPVPEFLKEFRSVPPA